MASPLRARVPGTALFHLPLGLSCRRRMLRKVRSARALASSSPAARPYWLKAMAAKQSEKML